MKKIEAIIVSFECLDLLSITLPRNLSELDNVIIVTKPEDLETIEYCESLKNDKITIFPTDSFTFDRAIFNKGLAIGLAMSHLKFKNWICTIDSDVILPQNFKNDFLQLSPDIEYFYGMRRINIDSKEDFNELERGTKKADEFMCYRGSGYGYFSCCHYQSATYQKLLKEWNIGYPFWVKVANEIDWIWRNNWGERVFNPSLGKFPECHLEPNNDYDTGSYRELPMRCLHLGMPGMNHEIRKTEQFI